MPGASWNNRAFCFMDHTISDRSCTRRGTGRRQAVLKWPISAHTDRSHKLVLPAECPDKKFVLIVGDSHLCAIVDGFVKMPEGPLSFGVINNLTASKMPCQAGVEFGLYLDAVRRCLYSTFLHVLPLRRISRNFIAKSSIVWQQGLAEASVVEVLKASPSSDVKEDFPDRLGRNVEAITMIYDVEGLGLKHLWKPAIETYGEILQMFENNYPEGLKRLFVIKAPKLFPVAFNLIKHFLSENTRHKINILGANWQEVLLKHIDAEELPMIYGGKLTDPDGDPRCRTRIHHVGPVLPSYYVRDHVKVDYEQCLNVSRGSSQQLDYEILFPGCVLRWQFSSEGADIGFGVFLKNKRGEWKKAGQMQEVVPNQRYNSHLVPEDGSLTCERPGV
ncbi:unnamed protein product, partial [Pleuronectes platessa]